jgi:septal ring factor EnvC (AmiA/AmiB activator)
MTEWTGSFDETGNVVAGNQLFVYGQEVDDFVFLKKEAIWTVATAALQEVDRQLQAEKTKTTTFETELQAEKTKTSTFETKLQEAEAKIATLQAEKEAIRSDLSSLVLRVAALES